MLNRGADWLVGAYCLLVLVALPQGRQGSSGGYDPCAQQTSCSDCVRTQTCAWCSDPAWAQQSRCFQSTPSTQPPSCPEKYLQDPGNVLTVVEDRATRKGARGEEAVQVAPQRLAMKLRLNEPLSFTLKFSQAEDYPIDLYYLMDTSQSMNDDKDLLSKLGDEMAESMQNITSDFRLGYGSFVDKMVLPYVSTVPKKLHEPCDGCVAPYGFKNHMKLSEDTKRFSKEVQRAQISGNLDSPEGGFDAILQAVVCREQIGWREKARRILVFSTDAGFHYAGDGKLGGIVEPHDGLCHMNSEGMYTHSTILDYPSISQVNQKVKENSINVIFAVTGDQLPIYEQLREHIEGSIAGQLSEDSSNVVDFIKENYDRISSSVEVKDNATSAVKVTYHSSCLGDPAQPLKATNQCDGLKVGTEVNFTVTVKVVQCPVDKKDWKQQVRIYPVGINESLIIDLEMLCDCPCENPGHPQHVPLSPLCQGHGTEVCGKCRCDSSHFGQLCECDADNSSNNNGALLGCRPDSSSAVECSGRGDCVCGQCECYPRANTQEVVSGQFCECDNFSCLYADWQLCSGHDHGTCVCGHCQCKPGWTGASCSCSEDASSCTEPGKTAVCSDRGSCNCGECECYEAKEGPYQGRYCERRPVSPSQCIELKDCVQCHAYKTGPLASQQAGCGEKCSLTVPQLVDEAVADEREQEVLCTHFNEDGCRYAFSYGHQRDGSLVIRAQRERVCPQPVFIEAIAGGVIGFIIALGLLLLALWKIFTTIHDGREYAKFKKDQEMSKWDTGENPIFKQATSTYTNPTYQTR